MAGYPKLVVNWEEDIPAIHARLEFLADRCYEELEHLTLDLDAEPLREGTEGLQRKIAAAVQMRNRISDIACALQQLESKVVKRVNSARAMHELRFNAQRMDPELPGKDAESRKAAAKVNTALEERTAEQWSDAHYILKCALAVARDREENIDKCHEGLSKQIKVLEIAHKGGERG
jgi:hypothetical protein